ncbi:MAG: cupin domain-containing protein [Maricaulaceae bacterium]
MMHMPPEVHNIQSVLDIVEIAKAIRLVDLGDSAVKVASLNGEYPFHSHDVDEVFYIVEGELMMDLDGSDSVPLGTGDIIKVPANLRHRTRTSTPSRVLLIGPQ